MDFGLSRQLPEEKIAANGLYHMSGMTGSLRYMAPEVYKGLPYKETCDTYSFCLLVWEMLTLEKPYDNMGTLRQVTERIFTQHQRPRIPRAWPAALRRMLHQGWGPSATERSDMGTIVRVLYSLRATLSDSSSTTRRTGLPGTTSSALQENDQQRPQMAKRYSTHVFQFSREMRPILRVPPGLRKELMRPKESLTSVVEDQTE